MIKAKESNVKPLLKLPDDFIEPLKSIVNKDYSQAVREQKNALANVVELQRNVQDYKNAITSQERDLEKWTAIAQEKETALAAFDNGDIIEKAQRLRKQLVRVVEIENVQVNGSMLIISTRPLFTKIRRKDGSRLTTRRCIGSFDISIGLESSTWGIRQTVFIVGRNHWAVGGSDACLGNWQPQYRALQEEGDWIGLVKLVMMYLRDTHDSGAYMLSHNWIDDRDTSLDRRTVLRCDVKVGDAVIHREQNRMAIVSELHPHGDYVRMTSWKGSSGTTDWVDKKYYVKITKVQYRPLTDIPWDAIRAAARAKEEQGRPAKLSTLVDALPDDTTTKALKELISNYGR